VEAFLAGSDMLLMPTDIPVAIEAMVAAVDSGGISRARLDSSVARVLQLKKHAGLFTRRVVPLDSIPAVVGSRAHQLIADDVAARALTLVQEGPIQRFRNQPEQTAVIAYAEETNLSIGNELIRTMRQRDGAIEAFRLYPASGPMSYDSAQAVIRRARRTVFAVSVRPIAGRGHIDLPTALAQLISSTDDDAPTVLASFGSPYLINQVPGFSGAYLLAWHQVGAAQRAVANALANGAAVTGRLPIHVSDRFPRGHGIELPAR
jgi:beta-N-acetylhexosaminidase